MASVGIRLLDHRHETRTFRLAVLSTVYAGTVIQGMTCPSEGELDEMCRRNCWWLAQARACCIYPLKKARPRREWLADTGLLMAPLLELLGRLRNEGRLFKSGVGAFSCI
jgi:hypothetical protein